MITLKYSISFVVSTAFGLLTLLVYIVVIKVLIQWRNLFNALYYKLFLISSVLCVLLYLLSWPIVFLPNAVCKSCTFSEFYDRPTFSGLTVLRLSHIYLNHAINFLEILMIFNRCTTIVADPNHSTFWDKFAYCLLILLLIFPVGFVVLYGLLYPESYVYYKEQSDSFAVKADGDIAMLCIENVIMAAGTTPVLTLAFCCFGGITMNELIKRPAVSAIEVELFIHAMINAISGIFSFFYELLTSFFSKNYLDDNNSFIAGYMILANTCISPYVLILYSRQLRNQMPGFSRCRRKRTATTAPMTSINFSST